MSIKFPKLALSALLSAFVVVPFHAHAQQPAAETPAANFTLTSNVGLFSQYVFRGISYTQEKPSVQGGFDLGHSSGLYLGIWGTNVSDAALNNAVGEIDVYGGYAKAVGDFTYDIAFLQFIFPGGKINGTNVGYNTLELSGAVTWRFINLKYSHTVGDYFGVNDESFGQGRGDSKGSNYVEANLNYEFMPSWGASLHAGRQVVKNYEEYNFTDWKVGVTKNFEGGWQAGAAYIDTNAKSNLYTLCDDNGRCKNTGDSKVLVQLKRTF